MTKTGKQLRQRKALGNALTTLRKQVHLKRQTLACAMQTSVSSIDKLEQGNICHRFTDAIALCEAMQVSVEELIKAYKEALEKLPPPRGG